MHRLVAVVGHQRAQLADHLLLRRLSRQEPWPLVRPAVPALAALVAGLPDVAALAAAGGSDAALALAARCAASAARASATLGQVAARVDVDPGGPVEQRPAHAEVRRALLALAAEAGAASEGTRLGLLVLLDAVSAELAARVAGYGRWPTGTTPCLAVVPPAGGPDEVAGVRLAPAEWTPAVVAVERAFDAVKDALDAIRAASAPEAARRWAR